MPRPKVDRTMRSIRLRSDADAALVAAAQRQGRSVNEVVEQLVRAAFMAAPLAPLRTGTAIVPPSRDVPTNFKKGKR